MQVLDIWSKRILEYIPDALARLNRGENNLVIRAISGNVAIGLGSAHILHQEFGIEIDCVKVKPFQFGKMETFCIEITLKGNSMVTTSPARGNDLPKSDFIDFPVYHLLLDWWLHEQGELQLFYYGTLLATIQRDGSIVFDKKMDRAINALCRCGLLWPANWQEIAGRLAVYDDVILGVDTNILFNCTMSEHLLPALSLANHRGYVTTPNWILFVVPSGVMHELEEAANVRDDKGLLKTRGRMGFRALQEVIELNQNAGIPGVSLLIAGEANPVLDTRIELQGLRADLCKSQQDATDEAPRPRKSSSGDMIIRSQFKNFLRQLDFHKGAYFITADKSNATLARAEGLCPIYVRPPAKTPLKIEGSKGEWVRMSVPTGKLIYEMAVQFRPLTIRHGGRDIVVKCDAKGETIDNWIYRKLEIESPGLEKLQSDYRGKFSLNKTAEVWNRLIQELVGLDG